MLEHNLTNDGRQMVGVMIEYLTFPLFFREALCVGTVQYHDFSIIRLAIGEL